MTFSKYTVWTSYLPTRACNSFHSAFSLPFWHAPRHHLSCGFCLNARFIGAFLSDTGDVPSLNITGSINGRPEREPMYKSPLCDIDVFQDITVQSPAGGYDEEPRLHRSCPPSIHKCYAIVSSPPMPLSPQTVPEGSYKLREEATTRDGRRISCVEGSFDVRKWTGVRSNWRQCHGELFIWAPAHWLSKSNASFNFDLGSSYDPSSGLSFALALLLLALACIFCDCCRPQRGNCR